MRFFSALFNIRIFRAHFLGRKSATGAASFGPTRWYKDACAQAAKANTKVIVSFMHPGVAGDIKWILP